MKLNTLQLRRAASALLLGLLMGVAMPKTNAQTAHVGDILCEGDLIVSPANYNASSHNAIGVVFYVDNTGQHGWAIALEDAGSYAWGPYEYNNTPLPDYVNKRQAIYDLDGYTNNQIVRDFSTENLAFFAVDYENGWYIPAIGQFNYLYGNLAEVNSSLNKVGGTTFMGSWEYWSSTENSTSTAWYINQSGEMTAYYTYQYNSSYKNYRKRVRAAINF